MATMQRRAYAEMFGPTLGDRVRLADTELIVEVERDFTLNSGEGRTGPDGQAVGYGEEVKFGGGKTIRDGMGQSQRVNGPGAKEFAKGPTKWITGIPTVYNADTLGIRPDLVKRKIESWSELLNPEWKGKTSIVSVPGIGIMDAAMAIEARGDIKYGDKGNMTKAEIDKTIDILKAAKKAGVKRFR